MHASCLSPHCRPPTPSPHASGGSTPTCRMRVLSGTYAARACQKADRPRPTRVGSPFVPVLPVRLRTVRVLYRIESRGLGFGGDAEKRVADLLDALRVLEAVLVLRPWGGGSHSGCAQDFACECECTRKSEPRGQRCWCTPDARRGPGAAVALC